MKTFNTKQKISPDLGFEDKLWKAADKLRGSMDASEYKHIVLGLIFLKYISASFEKRRDFLIRETQVSKIFPFRGGYGGFLVNPE